MIKDFRGNELKPGVIVAFNLSGEIAIGCIKTISNKKRTSPWSRPGTQFKIEVMESRVQKVGHISHVKHSDSLMTLVDLPTFDYNQLPDVPVPIQKVRTPVGTVNFQKEYSNAIQAADLLSWTCSFRNRNGKHYVTITGSSSTSSADFLQFGKLWLPKASTTSGGMGGMTFRLNPDWNRHED